MLLFGVLFRLLQNRVVPLSLIAALVAGATGCSGTTGPGQPPPDTTPPNISAVSAGSITTAGAVIGWTTNEASDSQVEYGTTTSYGQSSPLNSSLTMNHSVTLSGLTASTLYHYRVKSRDAAGNLATSNDFTFMTAAAGDTTPPTVSMTAPANNATVSGNVTLSANASDNIGVAGVQFLLDGTSLGAEDTSAPYSIMWDSTQATNGAHVLSARARDAAGNTATSSMVNVTVSNAAPPPLQLELVPVPTGGVLFNSPLDLQAPVEAAGVPAGRLFVVEQGGLIRIIQNGTVLNPPFLDVTGRSGFVSGGEEGLLGLAFHPNYATNGKFYVNYTSNTGGRHTVIAEFTASTANFADPSNERILLTVPQPESNHNGGGLAFGNDNFLYVALGDGGGGGDNHGTIGNGQDTTTLLGKILRIGVDPPFAPGLQYAIPPTNPFLGGNPGRDEIWLYGLRNPFRFSVDHATGNLWIGDVGQNAFEEVDLTTPQQGGANLGWRCKEGTHDFNMSTANCQTATFVDPIFDYSHASGDETVIGGYVYHGAAIPQLAGIYVFGDFISGRIWTLTQNAQSQWVRTQVAGSGTGGGNLSAFGQGQNGELYTVGYSSGVISHIHQVGTP